MARVYHYATVSKALTKLNKEGFVYDYNINSNSIVLNPENFQIVHIYRYEGDSNPDDSSTVYGIEEKSGRKGVFVSGYSANSQAKASKVLIDLEVKGRS
ncbi:MAG: hypothetical protein ABNG96_06490 [Flavobacterium sp.]|jgi:hypothetical protein